MLMMGAWKEGTFDLLKAAQLHLTLIKGTDGWQVLKKPYKLKHAHLVNRT